MGTQGQPTPDHCSSSVATPLVVPSCPVCGRRLTGKQTVCSPKCRIKRSMQRREANRQQVILERDAKIRLLLNTMVETGEAIKVLLQERPT
jgi:predicted nucleic acid-binding Zn ribbon protein